MPATAVSFSPHHSKLWQIHNFNLATYSKTLPTWVQSNSRKKYCRKEFIKKQDEVFSASTEWRIKKYHRRTHTRTHTQSDFLSSCRSQKDPIDSDTWSWLIQTCEPETSYLMTRRPGLKRHLFSSLKVGVYCQNYWPLSQFLSRLTAPNARSC